MNGKCSVVVFLCHLVSVLSLSTIIPRTNYLIYSPSLPSILLIYHIASYNNNNNSSDGQGKKVCIMIKLLRPFQLCIIDEFVADLDIF